MHLIVLLVIKSCIIVINIGRCSSYLHLPSRKLKMSNVQIIDDFGPGSQTSTEKTMSSREIAELTGKQHKHVLTDCDILNEHYRQMGLAEISAGVYFHPNTGKQEHREFQLTRMQSMDLMTGYSIPLRIKVNRRWEELEKSKFSIEDLTSDPKKSLVVISGLLQKLGEEQEQKLLAYEKLEFANKTIQDQEPKVLLANSVSASATTILVREMAVILKQNGHDTGEKRLYQYLRENGYLIKREGKDYNMPTQKSINLGLFFVHERTITDSKGPSIKKTPYVTGKGQEYFVNKFLSKITA